MSSSVVVFSSKVSPRGQESYQGVVLSVIGGTVVVVVVVVVVVGSTVVLLARSLSCLKRRILISRD